MRQSHGLFRPSDAFFQFQFSADYTINMFGFDFRQGQWARSFARAAPRCGSISRNWNWKRKRRARLASLRSMFRTPMSSRDCDKTARDRFQQVATEAALSAYERAREAS